MKHFLSYLIACSFFAIAYGTNFLYVYGKTHSPHSSTNPPETTILTKLQDAFPDNPVMIEIAKCESELRQFDEIGEPLTGGVNGSMIGLFQFNNDIHATEAQRKGIDIKTLEGNIEYAKILFATEGFNPWISSFSCWSDKEKNNAKHIFVLGDENPLIEEVQKALNAKGYLLAKEGPGSKGNETTRFGLLTLTSLRAFQCDTLNRCSGDAYKEGYGRIDEETLEVLMDTESNSRVSTSHTKQSADTTSSLPPLPSYTKESIQGLSQGEKDKIITQLFVYVDQLQRILNALLEKEHEVRHQ